MELFSSPRVQSVWPRSSALSLRSELCRELHYKQTRRGFILPSNYFLRPPATFLMKLTTLLRCSRSHLHQSLHYPVISRGSRDLPMIAVTPQKVAARSQPLIQPARWTAWDRSRQLLRPAASRPYTPFVFCDVLEPAEKTFQEKKRNTWNTHKRKRARTHAHVPRRLNQTRKWNNSALHSESPLTAPPPPRNREISALEKTRGNQKKGGGTKKKMKSLKQTRFSPYGGPRIWIGPQGRLPVSVMSAWRWWLAPDGRRSTEGRGC